VPTPKHLFHAAPLKVFLLIKEGGLKALSTGGAKDGMPYLCASAEEKGVACLKPTASDVVFRISTMGDPSWYQEGAGKSEWRKKHSVAPAALDCRRSLPKTGHKDNAWLSIADYEKRYGIQAKANGDPIETK
jgi:hypothetical protein